MLKLNNYDFEFDELFEESPITIEIRLKHMNDPSVELDTKKRACWVLSEEYQELAYAHYVLENYNEAKLYLKKAAPFAYLSGFDPELKDVFGDWNIQHRINLVILFGDVATKQKLKTVDWCLPTDNIIHQACYLYDHLLIKIGTGQVLSQSEMQTALIEARSTKDKDVQQYILPLIEAINALTMAEQALWQSSMDKVIAWHADACKFGDYKEDEQGTMSLNALTMAKLGKDMHGWECKTDSLYLPLYLIND